LVAERWPNFESRPEQLAMARRVQEAMREGFHLTVEAGTGVGKSFAYLAGAIDQALAKNGKVLISTHTINLQQQLIEKDIPFLTDIIPDGFSARLAKGRSHYLCSRRLDYAIKRKATLFDEDARALGRIAEWAEGTTSGSLSELEVVPPRETWQEVQSEHGNCQGRKCRYYSKCFYWKARRKLETADIIIANHGKHAENWKPPTSSSPTMPCCSAIWFSRKLVSECCPSIAESSLMKHTPSNMSPKTISAFVSANSD
jgi:ATP-dependent DNA helicase DinG